MITLIKNILRFFLRRNYQAEYLKKRAFSYLTKCHRILDVGCGQGDFIVLNPKKIVGIDTNSKTLLTCRKRGFTVRYGSATRLPFSHSTFDGLYCGHVIEHLYPHQVYQFLKQAAKVLKPDGMLVIESPLLWAGFYNNLTHLKPYPPQAITRYLVEKAPDTTFAQLNVSFDIIDLKWRYRPLINWLYPLGIHSSQKDGYLLVLKKNKK